jgi:CheY-like chemotaxis protein
VLIVDDVKANVDMLVGALRGEFKLSVALDGEAACAPSKEPAPTCLLLDIVMPGIDGYEVAAAARDPATREIPDHVPELARGRARTRQPGFELGAKRPTSPKPFRDLEVKGAGALAAQGQGLRRRR